MDLTGGSMVVHHAELVRWFYLLAIKCIEELIVMNLPWSLDVPLPIVIFTLPFIRRLDLGIQRFPKNVEHLVY